ncbi:MAG: AAA family ATPase [Spirochaetales bacterium]|nr:AAA family ATPase [Spirochaetales bacterium]
MNKSIAVAGKGGVGKSTLAALLIRSLCGKGMGPVLAIDSDPDANLGTLLGMPAEQTIGQLKEEMLETIKNFPAGMTKARYMQAGLHQLIAEADGFDLITMGRAEGPQCYCYVNSLIRKFCDDLSPNYSWTIIDNEAGLEHISRMTTRDIDALLIVINESLLSFDSAKKIIELSGELENRIKKIYLVTNRIGREKKQAVIEKIKGLGVDFLCDIPYNSELEQSLYDGSFKTADRGMFASVTESIQAIIQTIGGNNAAS